MYRKALTCAEVMCVYSLKRLCCKGIVAKKKRRVECFIKIKKQINKELYSKPSNEADFFWLFLVVCCIHLNFIFVKLFII